MDGSLAAALPLALGVAVSPVPIVASTVVLTAPDGRRNGSWFAAGWVAGLLLFTGTVVLAGDLASARTADESGWRGWVELGVGSIAIGLATWLWFRRVALDSSQAVPHWLAAADRMGRRRSCGWGIALAIANPKNAALIVAAGLAMAGADSTRSSQALRLGVFVVLGSLGVAVPVVLRWTWRRGSVRVLRALREWLIRHGAVIVAIVLALIGLAFVVDGFAQFGG